MSHRYKIGDREAWCKGCGLCVEFCPKGVFILSGLGKAQVVAADKCTGCAVCEKWCPDFALLMVDPAEEEEGKSAG